MPPFEEVFFTCYVMKEKGERVCPLTKERKGGGRLFIKIGVSCFVKAGLEILERLESESFPVRDMLAKSAGKFGL